MVDKMTTLSSTAYHPSSACASRATRAKPHSFFDLKPVGPSPLNQFILRKLPWQAPQWLQQLFRAAGVTPGVCGRGWAANNLSHPHVPPFEPPLMSESKH